MLNTVKSPQERAERSMNHLGKREKEQNSPITVPDKS